MKDKLRTKKSEPLLVDVGGEIGHDLIAFKQKFPSLPGKLIVQDIPVVIEAVQDLPSGIEAMKHDFLTPQPVKGAKAYCMCSVICHLLVDTQFRAVRNHCPNPIFQGHC